MSDLEADLEQELELSPQKKEGRELTQAEVSFPVQDRVA